MTLYSRESGVNLGAFVVRHTLSPGGGWIKRMYRLTTARNYSERSGLGRVQALSPTYRTGDPHLSHGSGH
jgi:hypothetical protein